MLIESGSVMTYRQIELCGFKVDVNNYGDATYLYPSFNGNREYRANRKGLKDLSRFLRYVKRIDTITREIFEQRTKEQQPKERE